MKFTDYTQKCIIVPIIVANTKVTIPIFTQSHMSIPRCGFLGTDIGAGVGVEYGSDVFATPDNLPSNHNPFGINLHHHF